MYRIGLIICLLGLLGGQAVASKLEKGFEALVSHDYFKARKLFADINHSELNAYASYGLASIFGKSNNPFFDPDSAVKYVRISYNLFAAAPKILKLAGVVVDGPAILKLADSIALIQLQRLKKQVSITACDRFLTENYIASEKIKSEVTYLRDDLEFDRVMSINRSDSTQAFLLTHPQSEFYTEAALLRDRQVFDEITAGHTAGAYHLFLKKYPRNVMANTAYEKLFRLHQQQADKKGLGDFVTAYPHAPQNLDAWKLLFTLSVKTFTSDELSSFLQEYPAFPLKNSILKELELNSLVLYPYHKSDDQAGFITPEGKFAIPPEFDAVTDFYDGLAVVSKNDSVYFINKENSNPFHRNFVEAYVFRHGLAPVKQGSSWYFINRLGQVVSRPYDEISEYSDEAYVVRVADRYGAVDQFGQSLLELKFNKLGDFKNGFAYYTEDGRYGFVSKTGSLHRPEFEWISDFDPLGLAIVKDNSKYGIVQASGRMLLPAGYDQIIRGPAGLFVLVSGPAYGFFSAEGCFLSPVQYDFAKDKPADYYTDGSLLRVIRKGEQSLMDQNGRLLMPFGSYAESGFFSEGLLRVKKMVGREGKYGYLDSRLNMVIPAKYDEAGDFADSLALVRLKNKYLLIDHTGAEVLSLDFELEKISRHYYRVDETRQVIDRQGRVVYNNVAAVSVIKPGVLALALSSGEIRVLYD